ncbi:MAG: recombinase family protein [Parcubacteria group bacterium]
MKYIIYCRKSTDTEDKQVLSLESQEMELLRLAEALNLQVVDTLKESKSAKEPGRPVFNEMMNIFKSGKTDAILCWKIDRLTRNPVDGGQIQWLLQNNNIKCIRTFEKNFLPSDNVLLMSIEQAMANQYIRELSVNVKRGNRAKLERGEWPNHAPLGYLNNKTTKQIVVDEKTAKYISRAFELYATGAYSFIDIAETLYVEGLRTASGVKVRKGHFHRMINNPFYYGIMLRDGKYYPGKHQPIISQETFEKAKFVAENKNRPRLQKKFFPLRGFLKCGDCGCALTASIKKGHHYYYCTNGKGGCEEHQSYMREKYLYEIMGDILDNIAFSERKIEIMYQSAKEKLNIDSTYFESARTTLSNELGSLTTRETRLLDAFLAEQITKDLYDTKVLEIQNLRISLTQKIKELEIKQPAFTLEPVKNVFLQASRARKEFLSGDDVKKRKVIENLLWNLSFKHKNISLVSLKSPYDIMLKAPKTGSISKLLADSS